MRSTSGGVFGLAGSAAEACFALPSTYQPPVRIGSPTTRYVSHCVRDSSAGAEAESQIILAPELTAVGLG
jgi:hypothetical protein